MPKVAEDKRPTKRYKLKVGMHQSGRIKRDPETGEVDNSDCQTYLSNSPNNIVESKIDLVAFGGAEKFELLPNDYPKHDPTLQLDPNKIPRPMPDLNGMPFADLMGLAQREKIEIPKTAKNPDQIREIIRAGWKG